MAVVQNEVQHVRADISALRAEIVERLGDHETRIRCLEKQSPWRTVSETITGIVAVIAVALGLKQP